MANTQIRTGNDKQTEIKHLYGDYIIYLTQRAQRAQSFNFHTIHAVAGDVASFTTTGERRGWMTNEYSKQPLLFRQPLRSLVARSQRPLQRQCCLTKSLRSLRPLRAEIKHLYGCVVYYLTQRAQRSRSFNFLLFTLTLEMS